MLTIEYYSDYQIQKPARTLRSGGRVRQRTLTARARTSKSFASDTAPQVMIGNGANVALFNGTTAEWIRLLSSFISAAQLDASAPLSSQSCPLPPLHIVTTPSPQSPHCTHTFPTCIAPTPSPHRHHTVTTCTPSAHRPYTVPTQSPHHPHTVPAPLCFHICN